MFTGIVEEKGKVASVSDDGRTLVVAAPALADVLPGASVSVGGVCLTVVDVSGFEARFHMVPETLARTSLASLGPGDEVNLERAMPADGRFDGHIVQGHVDGMGDVVEFREDAEGVTLDVAPPPGLARQIAVKGSVAIDGVSLTVTAADDHQFSVVLIPHTLETTTLGALRPGDRVNLETDMIAKYLDRLLEARR